MALLFAWMVNAVVVLATAYLVPGFMVTSLEPALLVAAVLGVVNALLGPIVRTLTQPLNVLTLGLFSLVVNAALLIVVSQIIPGFAIDSYWPTVIVGSVILALVSTVFTQFVRLTF